MYKEGYDLGYVDGYAQTGDYTIEYTYHTHDVPEGGIVTDGVFGYLYTYEKVKYCNIKGGCYNTGPVYYYYLIETIAGKTVNEGGVYVTSPRTSSGFVAADGYHYTSYTNGKVVGYMQDCGLTTKSIDGAIIKFNN